MIKRAVKSIMNNERTNVIDDLISYKEMKNSSLVINKKSFVIDLVK